jgi:hypothetical protein
MNMSIKNVVILLLSSLLIACANTKITESWVEPDLNKTYSRPMIIGISDSQQTRRAYENYFVAELKKKNITATASYTMISSKQKLNRETVENVLQGTDFDSVLVTYLVSADAETKFRDSPLASTYSGDSENNMMSSTLIVNPGRFSSEEAISLKNDFYDTNTKTIVFSVQTRTVAADSIDEIIKDVTGLLIKSLYDNDILK